MMGQSTVTLEWLHQLWQYKCSGMLRTFNSKMYGVMMAQSTVTFHWLHQLWWYTCCRSALLGPCTAKPCCSHWFHVKCKHFPVQLAEEFVEFAATGPRPNSLSANDSMSRNHCKPLFCVQLADKFTRTAGLTHKFTNNCWINQWLPNLQKG